MMRYMEVDNLADANSVDSRFMFELGYTAKIQLDNKTNRYATPMAHPTSGKFLIIMKSVAVHGKAEEEENPETNIITVAEKLRVKTIEEWKLEGYFPDDDIGP